MAEHRRQGWCGLAGGGHAIDCPARRRRDRRHRQGVSGISVLADYKTMDSGGKNVMLTAEQGGRIMTVCAGACDETVASAVAASKETGVLVIVDTIGVRDQVGRAREVERLGADSVYLHYGADQRRADATRDSTQWAAGVGAAIKVPLGVGTFGVEDGVRAASMGAEVLAIGHPLISGPDPLGICASIASACAKRIARAVFETITALNVVDFSSSRDVSH